MENSMWRVWARVLAYFRFVQVFLFVIQLLALAIRLIIDARAFVKSLVPEIPPEAVTAIVIFFWIYIVIGALFSYILMLAAGKLLESTEMGMDVNEALRKARIFKNVNIVCFVLVVLGGISNVFSGSFWLAYQFAIPVLWYGGEIYIVSEFIRELVGAARASYHPV